MKQRKHKKNKNKHPTEFLAMFSKVTIPAYATVNTNFVHETHNTHASQQTN